ATWAACGWLPLFLPGLGWHSYYALWGALGAWLALGVALERAGAPASVALVAALALVSAARADTPAHDWADAWFLRRAAAFVRPLRSSLLRQLPAVPPGSRLYFTGIPAEIGFVTGDGPMFRVLYHEPTLRAALLGGWTVRTPGEASGEDCFFHGDGETGLRRMAEQPLPPGADAAARLEWVGDQRLLAGTFFRAGAFERAGMAYARVAAALPEARDDAEAAVECLRAAGRDSLAARIEGRVPGRGGAPPRRVR
ncbi:MAG TPA: hypothetical protein VI504_13600, partial [Candidatus Eisenbacteria bacterium]